MEDKLLKDVTTNYRFYLLDKLYKEDSNLIKYIDESQNFYNGKQYPDSNLNNMIRTSMNICSFSATIKASKICGTPIYFTYTADNLDTDCTALRQFDEYNQNKLHIKSSNYQAALNGFVNGTEITFVRWDDDDTTYKGIYKGGLVEEHIDPRNFAVANPFIQDIQNQQWIMYWFDCSVKGVKEELLEGTASEKAEKAKLIERELQSGDEDEFIDKDKINHSLCRVFTRFFRIDGEVYYMCSTKYCDLFTSPHPLSRRVTKNKIEKIVKEYQRKLEKEYQEDENGDLIQDYDIDYEDIIANSDNNNQFSEVEFSKEKEKFGLYPFAVFRPFAQNRSFYGRSDIKQLIPIQKGINFMISMLLKCSENNAYNKIFVKPDTLDGQEITNEAGQVITDYSQFTNGWGIKFAESQPMPNGLLDLVDRLVAMTRVIYGFNDVMDGSLTNQDMSGYMLQQMIKQSNTSIEQQQNIFWEYNIDKASIRLLYYKHYVDKARYTVELTDAEYDGEEQARNVLLNETLKGKGLPTNPNAIPDDFKKPTHKVQVRDITNEDLYGINFDISIEALQGTSDSKLVEQQMWDNLLLNGGIQNISPDILEMYLSASPNVSPRTKAALKNVVENLKKGEISQLKSQLQELSQQTAQIMQYAKQLEAQNGYQSTYLKNLTNEFTSKINNQNKIIGGLTKEMDKYQTTPKMDEGEVKSNNSKGVSGTTTK